MRARLDCFELAGSRWRRLIHGDEPLPVDWLIVGGGSGQRHRQGVAFFFKQWGGRTPKAGGCRLDGVEWSEMPAAPARAISYLQQRG